MKKSGLNVTDESRSVPKTILLLAWPVFIEQILTTLVSFADTAMVGQLGAWATASVTISNSPIFLINGVITALGTGITAMSARATGQNDPELVKKVIRHALMAVIVIGIPLCALIIALHGQIPVWMGAAEDIIPTASDYNLITGFGRIFMLMSMTLGACFRGYGDTKTPLITNMAMNIENVIGNFLLIYPTRTVTFLGKSFTVWGAGLEVRGAAIATALGMFLSGMIALLIAFSKKNTYSVRPNEIFRFDGKVAGQIVKISIPSMLERICMSSAGIITARTLASLGTVCIAANSLCLTGESLSWMPAFAFQIAVTTLVGQCLGAGKKDLAEKFVKTTMKMALVTMTCTGILLYVFSTQIISFFSPDQEVILLAALGLRILAFIQPVQVAGWVLTGVLRGAGDTKTNFIITASTTWFVRTLLSVIAVRKLGMGLAAIIYIEDLEILVRYILLQIRYSSGKWKSLMDNM